MIKKIRIENFRGISKPFELSFKANAKRKSEKTGITKRNGEEILLAVGLLGKNASGKSSFIDGIDYFDMLIKNNIFEIAEQHLKSEIAKNNKSKNLKINIEKSKVINFIVKEDFNKSEKPMKFYIEFIDSKNLISLDLSFSNTGKITEVIKKNNEIFSKKTSELANYKSNIFSKELKFKRVIFESGPDIFGELMDLQFTLWNSLLKNKNITKDLILRWIRIADDKIVDIIWTSKNEIESYILNFNGEEKIISPSELSSGTKKWNNTTQDILNALFIKQTFIYFDEIDRALHPTLTKFIIHFFNDPKINKQKSQLLFTTHSPIVVDRPFRKDAINFITAKNSIENLGNNGIREDLSVSKNFLSEKLGSHPSKSDMFDLIGKIHD